MPTLDGFEQRELERHCLRIFSHPLVQDRLGKSKELFEASLLAQAPDAKRRIALAAERFARAAVETAVLDDSARPRIMWVIDEARDWFGVDYPASAWGGKNPDNFSRDTVIDDVSRYEIRGQRAASGPAQMTLMLYQGFIGTQGQSVEGAPVLATLVDRNMIVADDGSYTITIGPEAGEPGANHLQTRAGARFIHIRNAFSDWETQTPDEMRIRRLSGPEAAPPRSDDAIAAQAADLLSVQVPYWLTFFGARAGDRGVSNTIGMFVGRQGGWGYIASSSFRVEDDEALVITVNRLDAEYLSIQTSDAWSIPGDYVRRNVSLNTTQAQPNGDGSFTYVLAVADPGNWNWIDPAGLREGSFILRWQGVPAGTTVSEETAVRSIRLVKLSGLKDEMPEGTRWLAAGERQTQLDDRSASFARRLDLVAPS